MKKALLIFLVAAMLLSFAACAFDLKNPWHGGMNGCEVYLYSRETLPSDDSMLAPVGALEPENGVFKVEIPAESVIVLRQK